MHCEVTMLIGVPKEIKDHEYRVALTPNSVKALTVRGCQVLMQHNAGTAINFSDDDYREAGAEIAPDASDVYAKAEMIVKVKEPQLTECELLRHDQILFSYLHLVAIPEMTKALLKSGAVGIAYETIEADDGSRPLLIPMSVIAGRLATQIGAHYLEKPHGQNGLLLGGAPGAPPAKVVVLGAGTVGASAAEIACGMQADVFVLDKSEQALGRIKEKLGDAVTPVITDNKNTINEHLLEADLVVGALLVPGGKTPQVADRTVIRKMKYGAVIVDVAMDQGGCFETSRPTTHNAPTYIEEGVLHYCVTNMPGIVPLTSTLSLNHATLDYVAAIADKGWQQALHDDPGMIKGLSVYQGVMTHPQAATDLGLDYHDPREMLS